MDFVTPLISIIGSLIDTISVRIVDAADLDHNGNLLRNTLEELTEARNDLECHVVQAESLGLTCTNQVKGWLQRVEKIEGQVSSILQDIDQQKRLWCCCVNCSSRYKQSKKVLQKLSVMKNLMEKGKSLDINWDDRSIIVPVMEIPSGPVIGNNVMLQKVYELLREEVGVIGIYEMGGVGKTTLLKFINNEFLTLNHDFNVVISVTKLTTLERLFVFKILLRCIQFLYITSCEGLFYLQVPLHPGDGKRLQRLSINNCCDLQYLAIGFQAEKNWLPNLQVLTLQSLPSLITVWRNPVTRKGLQNLRSVTIWYCNKLKNVSWVIKLPKLELIYLFYCKEMEEIISEDDLVGEDAKAFQCLRTISIRDLPQLTSISQWKMDSPSLQQIAVIDCPKLKKLPLKAPGVSTLPSFTVYGEKEWWDNLEWDDAATGLAFLPHFIATQAT